MSLFILMFLSGILTADQFDEQHLWNDTLRTTPHNVSYDDFKTNFVAGLSSQEVDAVRDALKGTIDENAILNIYTSFDNTQTTHLLGKQVNDSFGFFWKPITNEEYCSLNEIDKVYVCTIGGHEIIYTTIKTGFNVMYFESTLAKIISLGTTAAHYEIFVQGLFNAMRDAGGGWVYIDGFCNFKLHYDHNESNWSLECVVDSQNQDAQCYRNCERACVRNFKKNCIIESKATCAPICTQAQLDFDNCIIEETKAICEDMGYETKQNCTRRCQDEYRQDCFVGDLSYCKPVCLFDCL